MKQRTYRGEICKRDQIRQFFRDNPMEELSYDDLVSKFDLNRASARNMIFELKKENALEALWIIRAAPTA